MIDPEFNMYHSDNFRQIEDIIDSRKLLGQYNVNKQNGVSCRYVYSSSSSAPEARFLRFDENMIQNEGDSLSGSGVKQTDSEITVVRIKCSDLTIQSRRVEKWNINDIAIPGDGSHLGESPSMVNLATLVGDSRPFEGEEYLVPLSSWDPCLKIEETGPEIKCFSALSLNVTSDASSNTITIKNGGSDFMCTRPTWAGRISKFIRKHCTKTQPLAEMDRSKF